MRDNPSILQVGVVTTALLLDLVSWADGFFMGTKHTTPPTQLPMANHKGKTYAKVGDQYVEYNDDEMYYDKHDTMKNQNELDAEDRAIKVNPNDPLASNSETRKEERYAAEQAWKEAKREDVDDVTGMPMYEGETYNQYGKMDYNQQPETYGGGPLGGKDIHEPHYGPPLNPYYGGPGGGPMHKDIEVPDTDGGGGGMGGGGMNQRIFANPFGQQRGFGGNPFNLQYLQDDYANYLKNPPRGILTINPLSDERTHRTIHHKTIGNHTSPTQTQPNEPPPYGLMPNISVDSFEKYHGPDGLEDKGPYGRDRRVIELNEKRASYALWLHEKRNSPDFDSWEPPTTKYPTTTTRTTKKTTTEFVPRGDVTIADYICNII